MTTVYALNLRNMPPTVAVWSVAHDADALAAVLRCYRDAYPAPSYAVVSDHAAQCAVDPGPATRMAGELAQ
jgi:hypothetical protein